MDKAAKQGAQQSRRHFLGLMAAAGCANIAHHAGAATDVLKPPRLPAISVQRDGHLLQREDGRPFFWLGDTAWELIHHTTREEASYYLNARARQRFTVIQTVVLSEFNGVTEPSALGLKPFLDAAFKNPNPAYFDRVVEIVDEAAALGLYVGLVPIWGDKLTAPWGAGPRLFRKDNLADAHDFASYVAARLRDRSNVIWILGGDRPARLAGLNNPFLDNLAKTSGFAADEDWTPIWRQVAAGIAEGLGRSPFIAYHPQGGERSSSVYLHEESWLSVNGLQSGHGGGHDQPIWDWVARDYKRTPPKPTLDLEPNYEDHPVSPWPTWNPAAGYFRDHDVRRQVYRSVFAGACGVTYGHHAVWGFVNARNQPVTYADMGWIEGIERPAGRQMQFLRDLLESRPYFRRIPDQTMIAGDAGAGTNHVQASRDADGSYAMIYFPVPALEVRLDLRRLSAQELRVWWYDPRTGVGTLAQSVKPSAAQAFRSPEYGPDWVLVLDDVHARYTPPGLIATT